MALAAATGFDAGRAALQPSAVIVDHQLQPGRPRWRSGSAAQTRAPGDRPRPRAIGDVDADWWPGGRRTRLRATPRSIRSPTELEAEAVLLGHTLDDQAESVLLG